MRLLCFLISVFPFLSVAQPSRFQFIHLTKSDGLSNSVVRAIAQDKYGYIWLGTLHGLNRFNGYSVTQYYHEPGNKGSLVNHSISALFCDKKGTLWIGSRPGLSYYDYNKKSFIQCEASDSITVFDMKAADEDHLWLATNRGVRVLDINKKTIGPAPIEALQNVRSLNLFVSKNGVTYFASNTGLHIYTPSTKKYVQLKNPVNSAADSAVFVRAITQDRKGQFWLSISNPDYIVYRMDSNFKVLKKYPPVPPVFRGKSESLIRQFLEDRNGNLWITSSQRGILKYEAGKDDFEFFRNDVYLQNSIVSDNINLLFEDKDGGIWAGTEGYGVDRFYPSRNYFQNIQVSAQQKISILHNWSRAACEDSAGNIWLGSGLGLTRYNVAADTVIHYHTTSTENKLIHSNSIRSLVTDRKGFVWIGTSDGLNRYNHRTNSFDFFDEKDGIKKIFVWTLLIDNNGVLWAGGNAGLYRWDAAKKKFYDFSNDSVLGNFHRENFRKIWQDSKGRYWLAANDLLLYDPRVPSVKKVELFTKDRKPLTEMVTDFAEDKDGTIWMAVNGTSSNGLIAYNAETGISTSFTKTNGLPSNETSGLLFDNRNRLWVATGNGLCYYDKQNNQFITFDKNDGLSSNQFNEQSACKTKDGIFIYPTYGGFVLFNPQMINKTKSSAEAYITSFKVLNKDCDTDTSLEDTRSISLAYNENFFSIELTTPYYPNNLQCWYAYKLEGFEKEWHYTRDRLATYTNVPGGNYTFVYKTTTQQGEWNTETKHLNIHIASHYTDTIFFKLCLLALIGGLVYGIYRYRLRQQEKIHLLKTRAGALEKEKAMAMYENLKQHLNPHFLFNSLTSLSGLIELDPKKAAAFLGQMSQIYRYILKNKDSELVHLGDELRFVDLYIALLKTRFNSGLQINIDVPEEYNYRKIVPVTLQNLIENAIKHNIIDPEEPLKIAVYVEDDYLTVENNLQKKKMVETSNKQGIANLKSFYSYLSHRSIVVKETNEIFMVKIPLI